MTTCYLKTSQPSLYQNRVNSPDYQLQLFAEDIIPVSKKTSMISLKISCKMINNNNIIPFMIIPDESLSLTPIRFSTSPLYINNNDYFVVSFYVDNTSGITYNIQYGTPVAKIVYNEKFSLVLA